MRVLWVLSVICAARFAVAERYTERRPGGFTVSAGAGGNVDTLFANAQIGRRFVRAPHVELYLDYSYDLAISEYAFHTIGIGARTYLARVGPYELYLQTLAATAVSQGGNLRTFGDRLLGPFFTQGVGIAYQISPAISFATTASTGDPVWLRYDVALRLTF